MARLLVEAVPDESKSEATPHLEIFVSVSRVDDGMAVTGLTKDNFRIAFSRGAGFDPTLDEVTEMKWEPQDNVASGCYVLRLKADTGHPWELRKFFALGIRAFIPEPSDGPIPQRKPPKDAGQTVVSARYFFPTTD